MRQPPRSTPFPSTTLCRSIGLDTTKVAQKFFGTAAPGSVAGDLPGDPFTDTTGHKEYVCNAPFGTATPACTSLTCPSAVARYRHQSAEARADRGFDRT